MYQLKMFTIAPFVACIIVGCATPPENPRLVEARYSLTALKQKPESSTLAAIETREASTALEIAEKKSFKNRQSAEIDQLAYLASQKVAFAEQTIIARKAESDLKKIDAELTSVQLDVRTKQLNALRAMNAKSTERGEVVTFNDVLFDTGRADIKSGGQFQLKKLANFLISNPERKVRIEGFTDSVGSDEVNQILSERRASAVANALSRLGVERHRIKTAGYGENYPIANNDNNEGRQQNRRVEVIVSTGGEEIDVRE